MTILVALQLAEIQRIPNERLYNDWSCAGHCHSKDKPSGKLFTLTLRKKLYWKQTHDFTTGFPDSSVGKESTCNAGDPGWIPGLGRSTGVWDRLPTPIFLGFPCRSAGKESACNEGDLASIPGLGRCPRERKVYPLQYSGLDLTVLGVVLSWTQLRNFHFHS